MAINFPNTEGQPTDGSFRFTQGTQTWSWNGQSWKSLLTTVRATSSDFEPVSPQNGDLWWNSDEGVLKIYYQDVDSAQWVDASPSGFNGIVSNLNGSKLVYVDTNNTHTYTPDGSILRPYKTIQEAYAVSLNNTTILIAPGTYQESLNITSSSKLSIFGFGSDTGNSVTIQGDFVINNDSSELSVTNVDLLGENNNKTLDIIRSSTCFFQGVNFNHSNPSSTDYIIKVSCSSSSTHNVRFEGCSISSNQQGILIDGEGERNVEFLNCYQSPKITMPSTNYQKVEVINCTSFGDFIHDSGDLFIDKSSIQNLTSTADEFFTLKLLNSSLRLSDNSHASIQKTGQSDYLIRNNDSDPTDDGNYSGTDLGYINHSKDQYYNKSGWAGVSNVKEALDDLKSDIYRLDSAAEVSTLDDVILRGNTTTTTAVIPFYYDSAGDFPNPAPSGVIAHSDAGDSLHFGNNSSWYELTNKTDYDNLKSDFDNLNYSDSYLTISNFENMKSYVVNDCGSNKSDLTISENPPGTDSGSVPPENGDLWWHSIQGNLYIYYVGTDSEGNFFTDSYGQLIGDWVAATPSQPQTMSILSDTETSISFDSANEIVISSNNSSTSIIPNPDISNYELNLGSSTSKMSNLFLSGGISIGQTQIFEDDFKKYLKVEEVDSENLPPDSAGDVGVKGDFLVDKSGGYVYVCIDTNSWIRFAIDVW